MVRAVRNWWIEANIDGRKTKIAAGPINRFGGFELRIYQRDDGEITNPVTIRGRAPEFSTVNLPGDLILEGYFDGDCLLYTSPSPRD